MNSQPVRRRQSSTAGPIKLGLARKLRLPDATALIVTNVIGVGIFTTPAIIASLVPSPKGILFLWALGGVLALAGAITYTELAKICPLAGGEYMYLSRAFGSLLGFLSGWTSLIAGFSGTVAASATGLVIYLGHYLPRVASATPIATVSVGVTTLAVRPRSFMASGIIVGFAIIHACGLGPGKLAQKTLAILLTAIIAVLLAAGFCFGRGSWSHFQFASGVIAPSNWLLALVPIMFTYSGWNAAAYVSEEIQDPKRNLGAALVLGTAITSLAYLALNVLYLFAIPVGEIRTAINVGDSAAQGLFSARGAAITPLLIIALGGAISAMTVAGPHVYFAMARDGVFPAVFGRLSQSSRVPVLAIALQATWSIVLVMLGGFEQILLYTGFAIVLSSGVAAAGLLVLRRRQGSGMTIRTTAVPLMFAISAAAMVFSAIYDSPRTSLLGLLLIAAGIPLFFFSRWRYLQPDCKTTLIESAVAPDYDGF